MQQSTDWRRIHPRGTPPSAVKRKKVAGDFPRKICLPNIEADFWSISLMRVEVLMCWNACLPISVK